MTVAEKIRITASDKTSTAVTKKPIKRPGATAVSVEKLMPKAPPKRIARKSAPVTGKTAENTPEKTAVKAVTSTAPKTVSKPMLKTNVKPVALPKTEKLTKPKKPKLVRDSFTIPKAEYTVLEELKQRTTRLNSAVKKSELIRAGIKALAAMSDTAFLAALKAVPTIKTGRPTKSKAD